MRSTTYIFIFVLIMTTVSALLLAGLYTSLKPIHDKNEAVFSKRQVMLTVEDLLEHKAFDYSADEVQAMFDPSGSSKRFEQYAIDANGKIVQGILAENVNMKKEEKKALASRIYPLYIFDAADKGKRYIVGVRGNGLWDKIWGFVAFKDDLNTVEGVAFDHAAETPGLGAEIKDNSKWVAQFKNEQIFDTNGKYVSVDVTKGGADPSNPNAVDGISGATITCNGVDKMLESGIEIYLPYLASIKKK